MSARHGAQRLACLIFEFHEESAMWDFDLMAAIRAIEKSMAYVLYRLGLCLGVAFGYLMATLGGAGTLVGFGSLEKDAISLGPIGAAIGFIAFAFLMTRIKTLWLRIVDLPQLGILADQWDGRILPTARSLLAYAKERLNGAYSSTSQLNELDLSVREVLTDMVRLHPCPKLSAGGDFLAQLSLQFTARISRLNHRTLLAWHFMSGHQDPWRSAAEALEVYDRHFSAMLRNRAILTAFTWLGFLTAVPLLDKGIEILVSDIPIHMGPWPLIFAGVFSWAIKAAFFDAIAEAAMLDSFFPIARREAGSLSASSLSQNSPAYAALQTKIGSFPS